MNGKDVLNKLSVPIVGQEEEFTEIEPTDAEIQEVEEEGESDLSPVEDDWDELIKVIRGMERISFSGHFKGPNGNNYSVTISEVAAPPAE